MEVRFKVNDDVIKKMQQDIGASSATDVTREALSILYWIIEETKNKRKITSSDSTNTDIHQLVTPWIKLL